MIFAKEIHLKLEIKNSIVHLLYSKMCLNVVNWLIMVFEKLRFGASDPPMIFESANLIVGFNFGLAYAKVEIAKITKTFMIFYI